MVKSFEWWSALTTPDHHGQNTVTLHTRSPLAILQDVGDVEWSYEYGVVVVRSIKITQCFQ